jgi:hypothetical protein
MYVDAAFALAVIVEFFHTQKRQHYNSLQTLFYKAMEIKKVQGGIPFPLLREVL